MADSKLVTELKLKRYLLNGGNKCPICGSDSIEGGPVQVDDGIAWQEIVCAECGNNWNDLYKLSGVETLSLDDDVEVSVEEQPVIPDIWGVHTDFPVEDWQYEVSNGDTRQGYWTWCASKEEEVKNG